MPLGCHLRLLSTGIWMSTAVQSKKNKQTKRYCNVGNPINLPTIWGWFIYTTDSDFRMVSLLGLHGFTTRIYARFLCYQFVQCNPSHSPYEAILRTVHAQGEVAWTWTQAFPRPVLLQILGALNHFGSQKHRECRECLCLSFLQGIQPTPRFNLTLMLGPWVVFI